MYIFGYIKTYLCVSINYLQYLATDVYNIITYIKEYVCGYT